MGDETNPLPLVIKVGGSLFDIPDLGPKLQMWLSTLGTSHCVLIPGGGATADAVREFDRCHHLGEERAHWLALGALSLNARLLAAILPSATLVGEVTACPACWRLGLYPIVDAYPFAVPDDQNVGALPHSWSVTSDSIAARIAHAFAAAELILLKSIALPAGLSWDEASKQGYVDTFFPQAAGRLRVSAVNFRDWHA